MGALFPAASSDYTAVSQPIVLTSQNEMPCVDIEIKQDQILEMDETLTLRLTTDMDNITLDQAQTNITITNDDGMLGYDGIVSVTRVSPGNFCICGLIYYVHLGSEHPDMCICLL